MSWLVLDVGTTNMRCRLVRPDGIPIAVKRNIGVRNTALTGSKEMLKNGLREAIQECLEKGKESIESLEGITCSGMITSNLGLYEIPHVEAPAGIDELVKGCKRVLFPEIASLPIWFIPGVKNRISESGTDISQIDFMRGEEVETMGILHGLYEKGPFLYVSPGSHLKLVFVNGDNQIEKSITTMSGELLWAVSRNTILADSISERLVQQVNEKFLYQGMDYCRKYGFSRACFMVRSLHLFTNSNENERANFLYGIILEEDIRAVEAVSGGSSSKFIIGGREQLRNMFYKALQKKGYREDDIRLLNDSEVDGISTMGALGIVEKSIRR